MKIKVYLSVIAMSFVIIFVLAEIILLVKFKVFGADAWLHNKYYSLKEITEKYHPHLGWDNFYTSFHGNRNDNLKYSDLFLISFGDSFTHCDEVQDNETWQHYLSNIIKKNVYNFGVPGYGTDQALMKLKTVYNSIRSKIVILGLIPENINRIVNVYRPFYYLETGIPLTKPRYILRDQKLMLFPNPIKNRNELVKLRSIKFIKSLKSFDYWSNSSRNIFGEYSFPYLKIFFHKKKWTDQFEPIDLWGNKNIALLMAKIFDEFISFSQHKKFIPIIMILPTKRQRQIISMKKKSSYISFFDNYCNKNKILCFDSNEYFSSITIDRFDSYFAPRKHLSPKGNMHIAEGLLKFINKHKLLK